MQRIGSDVKLHWTTPGKTTDGLEIKGQMTAQICRNPPNVAQQTVPHTAQQNTAVAATGSCQPVLSVPVTPGPTDAADPLPASLMAEPPVLLTYKVQILNSTGHTAGPSAGVFAASGPAQTRVVALHTTASRDGAVVEWQPQAPASTVELERVLVVPPTPTPAAPGPKAPQPFQLTTPNPVQARLRLPAPEGAAADTGGIIDHTAAKGSTYTYIAQRVRKVTLDGHDLEIRSVLSAPTTVVMVDTFPPARPTGLEAVPGAHSIDLAWEPGKETDLAGYNVFRQETVAAGTPAAAFSRLNSTIVPGPGFSDTTVIPGRRYTYRVTAVDNSGNESAPSAETQETLREQ